MSLNPPLPGWVFQSSLVPEALEILVAIVGPSQALFEGLWGQILPGAVLVTLLASPAA